MPAPLEGIRVLDFTIAMAGPLATQRLGDMGAEVIKVEAFGGDLTRVFALSGLRLAGETTSYLALNRNKRSIAIDLKSTEGLEIIRKLVESSDVVVQNFRPGVVERLGISYQDLKAINPKIVYASISGYGSSGSMKEEPGQDLLVQSFSGMTFSAGVGGGSPHPAPTYFVDTCASHLATSGILAALFQRGRTGEGQHIETDLLSGAMEVQSQEIMTYMQTQRVPERSAAPYASCWLEPPYGIYKTKNSWLALPQNDLSVLAEIIESSALKEHVDLRPAPDKHEQFRLWGEACYTLLSEGLLKQDTDTWMALMKPRKIWCCQVNSIADLIDHEQSQDHLCEFNHPDIGTVRAVGPTIRFSSTEKAPMAPPPKLGEHTQEILAEIGFSKKDIDSMSDKQVVK